MSASVTSPSMSLVWMLPLRCPPVQGRRLQRPPPFEGFQTGCITPQCMQASRETSPGTASRHIRRRPTWERAPALATCSYAARRSRARQGESPVAGGPVAPGAEAGARQSGARCLVEDRGRAAGRRARSPLGGGHACRRGTAVIACGTLLQPENGQFRISDRPRLQYVGPECCIRCSSQEWECDRTAWPQGWACSQQRILATAWGGRPAATPHVSERLQWGRTAPQPSLAGGSEPIPVLRWGGRLLWQADGGWTEARTCGTAGHYDTQLRTGQQAS